MADSPFQAITPPAVVGVRDISYTLFDPDPDGTEQQAMRFDAQIVWSDDSVTHYSGNVVPYLTNAEVAGLQTLLARLRGKAETAWGDAP